MTLKEKGSLHLLWLGVLSELAVIYPNYLWDDCGSKGPIAYDALLYLWEGK